MYKFEMYIDGKLAILEKNVDITNAKLFQEMLEEKLEHGFIPKAIPQYTIWKPAGLNLFNESIYPIIINSKR